MKLLKKFIKKTILKMNVVFEELNHKYYTISNDGSKIYGLSMTKLISKYKQPFLDTWWKIYKSVQHQLQITDKKDFSFFCKERGCGYMQYKDIEDENQRILFFKSKIEKYVNWNKVIEGVPEIKKQWDENNNNATDVGTEFHEYKEAQVFKTGKEKIGNKVVSLADDELNISSKSIKFSVELSKLKDGYHPEVLLYTSFFIIDGVKYNVFLVGQVDKLFIETIKGIRYVDIDDYKTNKELKFENKFAKMKPPLQHLDDCDGNHYSLQTIGYSEILRQHGFVPRNIHYTHHDIKSLGMTKSLNENVGKEKVTSITVNDLKEEFNAMIKDSFPAEIQYKRNYVTKEEKKEINRTKSFLDYE